jgi:hypothetical protein
MAAGVVPLAAATVLLLVWSGERRLIYLFTDRHPRRVLA